MDHSLKMFTSGVIELEQLCLEDLTCSSCPYRKIPRREPGAPLIAFFGPSGGLTNIMDSIAQVGGPAPLAGPHHSLCADGPCAWLRVVQGAWLALRHRCSYGIPDLHIREAFVELESTRLRELQFEDMFDMRLFERAARGRGLAVDTTFRLFDFPRRVTLPALKKKSDVGRPDDHVRRAIALAERNGDAGVSFGTPLSYSVYYPGDEEAHRQVAYFFSALLPPPEVRCVT
jgi:hypothetical protein